MRPFQIIFNPTSAAELAKMPKELQLQILGEFRGLPQQVLQTELDQFGKLERTGRILHRFRVGDYLVSVLTQADHFVTHVPRTSARQSRRDRRLAGARRPGENHGSNRQLDGGRRFIVDGQVVSENARGELQTIRPAPLLERCSG